MRPVDSATGMNLVGLEKWTEQASAHLPPSR
jgi:hypothetical protein